VFPLRVITVPEKRKTDEQNEREEQNRKRKGRLEREKGAERASTSVEGGANGSNTILMRNGAGKRLRRREPERLSCSVDKKNPKKSEPGAVAI